MSRFGGVRGYREFMHREIEKEVVDFYKGPYQKPILGDKGFIEWVRKKLGDKARVEEAKPESRRVFGLGIEEIVRETAREYKIVAEDLRRRGRGEASEARSMAMYLCRVLGGHKHGDIGKAMGLEKTSSVSSACLRMKSRMAAETKVGRRARRIEEALRKS
jgi:chromosomal replication initiation ATPase DnaA